MDDIYIIDTYNKSKLIKINFNSFIKNTRLWNYNRNIKEYKVNELYNLLINNKYDYPWIVHAILDKKTNNIEIIDGQHRYTAIEQYNILNNNKSNELFVWMWIYEFNDISGDDTEDIITLFKNINNNMPIDILELPDNKIANLIKLIKKDNVLKEGIGINIKTNSCHSPYLHEKELNILLLKYNSILSKISNEELLDKLKKYNEYIGTKTIDDIYKNANELNIKVYNTAKNIKFYLGLKNSNYGPDKWIRTFYIQQ